MLKLKNAPSENHLGVIDAFRGLAALAVCVHHFAGGTLLPENNFLRIIASYGHLGVYIFFILSGFVLPLSMYKSNYRIDKFHLFVTKRLLRLDPPYLISIVIILCLNYLSTLSSHYKGDDFIFNAKQLALHFAYLNAFFNEKWLNPVFWTLAIEFQFYLLIAFVFPLLRNKISFYFVIVTLAAISLSSESYSFIIKFLPFFLLGMLMFKFYVREISKSILILSISLIYLLIGYKFGLIYVVSALLPLLIIINIEIKNKILVTLGHFSYSLYLLHVPIGMRMIHVIEIFTDNIGLRVLMLFIVTVIMVGISYIYYLIIEKPSIRLSKKISYQHSNLKAA
ncbi:acyltransferase family protein [Pedobacter montanisoli]|uniref:Acyltransferase n=1 Tax=Pedobacter montanisoli TaxID=2923277 RepID=A0ABS9ZVV1_9SPHI|nr:acyltransferase [Pedobacter montanisoli]MCJ0742439.1 acyltransferase [Pedobacter montanisoli]